MRSWRTRLYFRIRSNRTRKAVSSHPGNDPRTITPQDLVTEILAGDPFSTEVEQ